MWLFGVSRTGLQCAAAELAQVKYIGKSSELGRGYFQNCTGNPSELAQIILQNWHK